MAPSPSPGETETYQRVDAAGPRPVFISCLGVILGAALLLGAFVAFVLLFLESGGDSGDLVLEQAAAYAPGSIEYVAERNFYLVRLASGEYHALADLDAANRANAGRRCRAAPVAGDATGLAGLVQRYGGRMSPEASGSSVILREDCYGALYDVTGVRLDADGRNLDRYAVSTRGDGRLVVDISKRRCSERSGRELLVPVECP
jgi:hypothetical protein